eukprot:56937-Lingulodinium_polyedra.AAC.1
MNNAHRDRYLAIAFAAAPGGPANRSPCDWPRLLPRARTTVRDRTRATNSNATAGHLNTR